MLNRHRHRTKRLAACSALLTVGLTGGLLVSGLAAPSPSVEVAVKTLVALDGDSWTTIAGRLAPGASASQVDAYAQKLATQNDENVDSLVRSGQLVFYIPSDIPVPTTSTTAAPSTTPKPIDNVPTTTAAPTTAVPTTAAKPAVTPTAHFSTSGPGAALASDADCAARVRRTSETNSGNNGPNHTTGRASSTTPRVTGNFTGTTDEILQWAACKWGIDEDVVRAMAWQESRWSQFAAGDRTANSNPANCGAGQTISNGSCPESIGITQVRTKYYGAYDHDAPWTSTAYNVDVWGAEMRKCYNGELGPYPTWLRQHGYAGGDLWGCLGWWFSGDWHDQGANDYISLVKGHLAAKAWPKA